MKLNFNFNRKVTLISWQILLMILIYFCLTHLALAADDGGSGPMPWETPLQKVMDSISGPVAKILGVLVIMLAGFSLAFGEVGSGVKRLLQVVLGLAIAFSAASIVGSLFF